MISSNGTYGMREITSGHLDYESGRRDPDDRNHGHVGHPYEANNHHGHPGAGSVYGLHDEGSDVHLEHARGHDQSRTAKRLKVEYEPTEVLSVSSNIIIL